VTTHSSTLITIPTVVSGQSLGTLIPEPIELPSDLPAFYRAHIDDLVGTLSEEGVAGRASNALHQLIDTVVVSRDAEAKVHLLELRGQLLETQKSHPRAAVSILICLAFLVAGGRNSRTLSALMCVV